MPEDNAIADNNRYIESELPLPRNGKKMSSAKLVSWLKYKNGKLKGTCNNNPILDTRMYAVMFPYGAVF